MGTTIEKLQNIMSVKTLLKAKFALPDDLPFAQYPNNMNPVIKDSDVITVSDAGTDEANGVYYLARIDATASDRIWLKQGDTSYKILAVGGSDSYFWSIQKWATGNNIQDLYYTPVPGPENPWDETTWTVGEAAAAPAPTVTNGASSVIITPPSYYKCASVGSTENGGSEDSGNSIDIIVSGAGMSDANGTYTLVDTAATGYDRVWSMTNNTGTYTIKWYEDNSWYLDWGTTYPWLYCDTNASENPYDTEWVSVNGNEPAPTVTQASSGDSEGTAPDTEAANTWSGYKAVLKTETVTTEGETVLIVSDSGIADGTYKLMDSTAIGESRIWKHIDSEWYFVWTGSMWVINASPTYEFGQEAFYPDTTGDENPWEIATWWGDEGIVNMSITSQTTEGTSETKKYYEFSEVLTEGLTYGDGFTPVVGKVYDRKAMAEVKLKQASIEKTAIFAEAFNGSIFDKFTVLNEAPQFATIANKPCMFVDHAHRLSTPCSNFPMGNAPRSIAANLYFNTLDNYSFYVGYGGDDSNTFNICTLYEGVKNYHRGSEDVFGEPVTDKWYYIVMTFDGTTMKCYINGFLSGQYNYTYNTNVTDYPLYVGYLATQSDSYFDQNGYIANLSVYDRALTEEEIQQLYQEFKA